MSTATRISPFVEFMELSDQVDQAINECEDSNELVESFYITARRSINRFENKIIGDMGYDDRTISAYCQMLDCLREISKEKYEKIMEEQRR
jgi:hypothetical protein